MKNKLILLCAPSGTGKTTIARMLVATDSRFCHVQVLTTRPIRTKEEGRMEKVQVKLETLQLLQESGELVNFNKKDKVWYGITRDSIESAFKTGVNPVLEWDVNSIDFWDYKYPVFKVILKPSSKKIILENLKDGRDPNGVRQQGVLEEIKLIESGKLKADIILTNFESALLDSVHKIRKAFFKSLNE